MLACELAEILKGLDPDDVIEIASYDEMGLQDGGFDLEQVVIVIKKDGTRTVRLG